MPGRGSSTAICAPVAAEATRDLYARHGQRVYSFCRSRLGNAEEAQDAAQTTFVYVLSALNRGVVPRNELAWLLTIADNVCRSTRRSIGRRLARVASADVDELEAAATSISIETHETLDDLRGALEQLPVNQRRAILLREWQGLSYADIADQLGLTVAAVETLLFRARRSLAARLERRHARLRALDLGSVLAFLRSLLGGAIGKLAVGLAGVAIVAALPGVGPEAPAVVEPSPSVVTAASPAPERVSSAAQDTARVLRSPARATRARRVRARTSREHTARPVVRSAVAPPAQAPSAAAPPAAAAAGRPSPPPVPVPATLPPAVPAPPPVDVTAAASTVVTTATGTVGAVVATVVPPLPQPVKLGP